MRTSNPSRAPPRGALTRTGWIALTKLKKRNRLWKGAMSKKLRGSLYVALAGVFLLLLQSAPTSAQVLSETISSTPLATTLTKQVPNVVGDLTVTAPATGCPCQAIASYFAPIQAGSTTGGLIEGEVVDESNPSKPFALTEQAVPAGANRSLQRTDVDGTTIANGQVVDFQLLVEPKPGGMQVKTNSILFEASFEYAIIFIPSSGAITRQ
jgi:hypothetical protein